MRRFALSVNNRQVLQTTIAIDKRSIKTTRPLPSLFFLQHIRRGLRAGTPILLWMVVPATLELLLRRIHTIRKLGREDAVDVASRFRSVVGKY